MCVRPQEKEEKLY